MNCRACAEAPDKTRVVLSAGPSAALLAAIVGFARGLGVTVREPVVLRDRANLIVHLSPAPVVARVPALTAVVRTDPAAPLRREIAVTGYLAACGVPVAGPAAELPPGPHVIAGVPVTFLRFVEHDGHPSNGAATTAAVRELHHVLGDCPEPLPFLSPAFGDLAEAIDALAATGDADAAGELQRAHADVCSRLLALDRPVQVLHGDCHVNNILVTRDGLVWNDFEDCCRGPIEWDLATLDPERHDPANGALEACRAGRALQVRVWNAIYGGALTRRRAPERRR